MVMTVKDQQRVCDHRYEVVSITTYGPIPQSRERVHKRCRRCHKMNTYYRYRRDVHENSYNRDDA